MPHPEIHLLQKLQIIFAAMSIGRHVDALEILNEWGKKKYAVPSFYCFLMKHANGFTSLHRTNTSSFVLDVTVKNCSVLVINPFSCNQHGSAYRQQRWKSYPECRSSLENTQGFKMTLDHPHVGDHSGTGENDVKTIRFIVLSNDDTIPRITSNENIESQGETSGEQNLLFVSRCL